MGNFISNNNTEMSHNTTTTTTITFTDSDISPNECYTLTVKTKGINFAVDINKSLIDSTKIIEIINKQSSQERVCINIENCCIFYEPDRELLTYEMWSNNVSTEVECHVPRQQMIDALVLKIRV